MNLSNYELPEPHTDFTRVCFVEEHSDFVISSRISSITNLDRNKVFNNFFIWTQRIDLIPSMEDTLEEALNKGDAVVIINPVKEFDETKIRDINLYLENGGNVLLMDSILNENSTASDFLNYFGIRIDVVDSNLTIVGNDETYFVEKYSNYTSIAVNNVSNGKLVVMVDSQTFSNTVMGGSFTIPNLYQREIYDAEFYIFEEILFAEYT
jgi:hypothetical protein